MPEILAGVPSREWRLSSEGKTAARRLAREIADYSPEIVITSTEPKAAETGWIVANALDIPVREVQHLHENDRSGLPYLGDDDYLATFARFFSVPDKHIVGHETAREATDRFARAINALLCAHPTGTIAVVAHGTVISLYLQQIAEIDPFPLWQRLGLPSFVVVSRSELRLERIAERM